MNRTERVTKLAAETLEYFQALLQMYKWDNKAYFKILIGSEGMGPEISIFLRGSQFDPNSPEIEIQFWLHNDDTKYVLIYSSLESPSNEIEHISQDLSEISEAKKYFDKAIQLLGLEKN